MKKTIRIFAVLLACVMLSAVFAFSASAASNVTYNGNAGTFIFAPGSEHSPTDLFADFKGVMPGDKITQQIFIDNDVDNGVKVTLYMRALGAHADSVDFFARIACEMVKFIYIRQIPDVFPLPGSKRTSGIKTELLTVGGGDNFFAAVSVFRHGQRPTV